jgi:hypothetical protein
MKKEPQFEYDLEKFKLSEVYHLQLGAANLEGWYIRARKAWLNFELTNYQSENAIQYVDGRTQDYLPKIAKKATADDYHKLVKVLFTTKVSMAKIMKGL